VADQAEVEQLGLPIQGDEDIGGLDVAMDQEMAVGQPSC
jgi:hypothetical protein